MKGRQVKKNCNSALHGIFILINIHRITKMDIENNFEIEILLDFFTLTRLLLKTYIVNIRNHVYI